MNFLFLGGCGVKSTVVDMSRFGQMYLDEGVFDSRRILSKASVRTLTANHNTGLPLAYHNGGIFDPAWGLGWNMGSKKDDAGMLRSASSFEHGGFGCVKLLCDPQADIVAAFFTVSRFEVNRNVMLSVDYTGTFLSFFQSHIEYAVKRKYRIFDIPSCQALHCFSFRCVSRCIYGYAVKRNNIAH